MSNKQKEPVASSFPYQLKLARTQRGWSQARLADELGIDIKTVSRWECGQAFPAAYLREKLCELFSMSPQELGLLDPSTSSTTFDPVIPLPPAISLVGRDKQISTLRQRLRSEGNSALSGLPGVGKTALAVALANDLELRTHFCDGILWAGLGPNPNMLGHMLRWGAMLGISPDTISDSKDIEAWAAALHLAIGKQKMLFILDDVWRANDALKLNFGGPACAHLVTTRFSSVATQLAADGVAIVEELTGEEGMTLLRALAPQVVEQEQSKAVALVEAVGGLPLALTLMGNYLRMQGYQKHTRRVLTALQLLHDDASARLNLQETRSLAERHPTKPGAPLISLGSIIAVSDQPLDELAHRALCALSVFPPKPNSFSEEAALAIARCNPEVLDTLTDTGLLQINSADRYLLHPTIADYAGQQLEQSGCFDLVRQRLVTYMTHFVESHSTNYQILGKEHGNILAALEVAFVQDGATELPRLVCACTAFFLSCGLSSLAKQHLLRAYQYGVIQDDEAGQANVLVLLEKYFFQENKYKNDLLKAVSLELSAQRLQW